MRNRKCDITNLRLLKGDRRGMMYLAMELLVFDRHRSGVVLNFSITRLANFCGCSRKTARETLAWGMERGFCKVEGSRLSFKRAKLHPKQNRRKGHILTPAELALLTNLKNAFRVLQAALLIHKIHSMNFIEHRKGLSSQSLSLVKKQKRDGSNTTPLGDRQFKNCISYFTISRILYVSPSTALRVMNFLRSKRVVRRKRRKGIVSLSMANRIMKPHLREKFEQYQMALELGLPIPSGVIFIGGRFYYQEPNSYALPTPK